MMRRPAYSPESVSALTCPPRYLIRRPAGEPVLLCPAGGVDGPLERPGGPGIEQHVQQRDIAGLAGEHGLDPEREQRPRGPAGGVAPDPRLERLPVPHAGLRRGPGSIYRDPLSPRLEPGLRPPDIDEGQRADP